MSRAFDLRSVVTAALLDDREDLVIEASCGLAVARNDNGAATPPPQRWNASRRLTVTGNTLAWSDDAGIRVRAGRVDLVILWEHITAVQVGRLVCMVLPGDEPPPSPRPPRKYGRLTVYDGGQ